MINTRPLLLKEIHSELVANSPTSAALTRDDAVLTMLMCASVMEVMVDVVGESPDPLGEAEGHALLGACEKVKLAIQACLIAEAEAGQ